VKTILALMSVSALLVAAGYGAWHPLNQVTTENLVHEQFHAGPLTLEIRLRKTNAKANENYEWPVSEIGVNTSVSGSLSPFSIRVVLVFNVASGEPEATALAALALNEKRPSRLGRPLDLLRVS
jgi:hypothetical protein